MNCTTTTHYWLWTGSSSTLGVPEHLPCQCRRYTRQTWMSLESENARLAAQVAALREALVNITNVLGPAACACEGQQVEVDIALGYARAALAAAGWEGQG